MARSKKVLWESRWKFTEPSGEKLGQGGQGVVRRVENLSSGELGALKELIQFTNAERRKRMHIEAESLAVLEHPHICKLLDSDTTSDGRLYLVTEFIEGETLFERVSQGCLDVTEAVSFSRPLLDAVQYAHSVGVIHRDIKPDNILLRAGALDDPVLIDFGILFNNEETLISAATIHGQQLGNRFLHLPELQKGSRDPRSDLTQVCGLILYAMTAVVPVALIDSSGRLPHQVPEVAVQLASLVDNKVAKDRLLRVFDRAFQVRLEDRWQSVKELSVALENVIATEASESSLLSLAEIRLSLESDPGHRLQKLTKSSYDDFMKHTRAVTMYSLRQSPFCLRSFLGKRATSVILGLMVSILKR